MSKTYFFKWSLEYDGEINENGEWCPFYKDKVISVIDSGYNKKYLFSTLCYYLQYEIECEDNLLVFIGEDLNIIPDYEFYIEQVLRYYRE